MTVLKLVSSAEKNLNKKFDLKLDGHELSYLMFAMDLALVKLRSIEGDKEKIRQMLEAYEKREGALISRHLTISFNAVELLTDRLSLLWNLQDLPVTQSVMDERHGR